MTQNVTFWTIEYRRWYLMITEFGKADHDVKSQVLIPLPSHKAKQVSEVTFIKDLLVNAA